MRVSLNRSQLHIEVDSKSELYIAPFVTHSTKAFAFLLFMRRNERDRLIWLKVLAVAQPPSILFIRTE